MPPETPTVTFILRYYGRLQGPDPKIRTWRTPDTMYVRSGLQADELWNVGGDDFRLKHRCIGLDVTDLAGGDFILCNFAGLAGTGINQRLRAILELAGAARGNHNVAKIAIELLLNTHGVSLQKMPWPTHTGAASALTTPKAWSTGLIRASEFRW